MELAAYDVVWSIVLIVGALAMGAASWLIVRAVRRSRR
ncbi:hypothetical protein JOF28_002586 [Leucobacter exalbidus]|uniref:Uncharacterized protein n=1 Tax=Leucobacter exalbidus TaxID=662960 RepID=A0A940PXU7_9MICO|nr:hypothetical protein [Leucobacter exalbidus]